MAQWSDFARKCKGLSGAIMNTVSIDGAQLTFLELYRMALSEDSQEKRLRAIKIVTHDVVARQLNLFASSKGKGGPSDPKYSEFSNLVMQSPVS
ncbi:hypothetical protein [Sulfitobacter sp.]|uniref:hypothetical protein n=1 Tax=Sulfitobacter sp. TaxID=1903071 RepID=UPI003EF97D41